jgi:hypothetical protein
LSPSNRLQQQQPSPQETPYVNNQEAILKYILSQPDIAEQVMRQYGVSNVSTSGEASNQTLQQSNLQYQAQPSPSQQHFAVQSPTFQTTYHQQQQARMQFHQSITQQQQPQVQFYQPGTQQQHQLSHQQQPRHTSSSVIHYLPNNTDQPSPSIQQTNGQFQFITTNDIDAIPSQFLEQINILNLTDESLNQLAANSAQQQMITDEVKKELLLYLYFLIGHIKIYLFLFYKKETQQFSSISQY